MRVLIDTSPLSSGHSGRGIGIYTRLLIDSLQKYFPDHEFISSANTYSGKVDVVHYPYFDFFFLTLQLIKQAPSVVTIHDAIPLVYPSEYKPGIRGGIKYNLQRMSLNSVTKIVTDSFCSSRDVISLMKQPQSKVSTIYIAPDPSYKPATKAEIASVRETFDLNKPYLLYVGDINYNKNLPGLFRAFAKIHEQLELVLVSKAMNRTNPAAASLWKLVDELGIEPRMKVLTAIPAGNLSTLKGLYSGAAWYVQPSFYEGFGLPVLEAQRCGCPVLSSIGGSLSEIIGDSAMQFDPTHDNEFEETLHAALSMTSNERSRFIEQGFANQERFNWQQTASDMISTYESVAGYAR